MNARRGSSLAASTRAAAIPEAVIVLNVLFLMLLGGMEIGLMTWTKATLQSVANMTARCVAIGSSDCTNSSQYVINLAAKWLGPGMITSTNTTIAIGTATTCKTVMGAFITVSITASPWSQPRLYPFVGSAETLSACYPT